MSDIGFTGFGAKDANTSGIRIRDMFRENVHTVAGCEEGTIGHENPYVLTC